jgi:salicylate hydroxylase/6-hydroxynicotinate 3-monooxygenase
MNLRPAYRFAIPATMREKNLSIAIAGAGMGGLTVAATLRHFGMDVQIYEQAPRFTRIGAGIQMMPNSMRVLRQIGIEQRLREVSFAPHSHLNRVWDTGEVTRELPMPEGLYGAPYLCMHRGVSTMHSSRRYPLRSFISARSHRSRSDRQQVTLTFADGSRVCPCGNRPDEFIPWCATSSTPMSSSQRSHAYRQPFRPL